MSNAISSVSASAALAAYQPNQSIQPKPTQQFQSAPEPKQDTVHLSSAATGDIDHDGDSR